MRINTNFTKLVATLRTKLINAESDVRYYRGRYSETRIELANCEDDLANVRRNFTRESQEACELRYEVLKLNETVSLNEGELSHRSDVIASLRKALEMSEDEISEVKDVLEFARRSDMRNHREMNTAYEIVDEKNEIIVNLDNEITRLEKDLDIQKHVTEEWRRSSAWKDQIIAQKSAEIAHYKSEAADFKTRMEKAQRELDHITALEMVGEMPETEFDYDIESAMSGSYRMKEIANIMNGPTTVRKFGTTFTTVPTDEV